MSVSYVVQKCTSCAGTKFDYDKETKMWKCLYCGALIERHEQADTMFTIKNVVRQSLLDIAYKRMSSAQNNLVECKKIDSRYVGTIIAELAYEMNMIVNGGISKSEQQNYFAMMKKNYMALKAMGDSPTEEELVLYEFFDSAEVTGVLILLFDSMNAIPRRDVLLKDYDASEVYSMDLNSNLINFAVKNEKYDLFDQILHNADNINKKAVMKTLLLKCPYSESKAENVIFLIEKEDEWTEDDRKLFESYISDSMDDVVAKCQIAAALCKTPARPSVECLMDHVISQLKDSQIVYELMSSLISDKLLDVETATIVNYSVFSCEYDICLQNLRMLYESDNFVELNSNHFKGILGREDFDTENKKSVIDEMLKFEIPEKVKYRFISDYLCDGYDEPDTRLDLLQYLFSLTDELPTNSVEKYILNCMTDKELKAEIIKLLFEMKLNRSFFHQTLSNYIIDSTDAFDVKKEVIYQLLQAGLKVNANACAVMLLMQNMPAEQRTELLRMAKASGVNYDDVIDIYISSVQPSQFESSIFGELIQSVSRISNKILFRYVLELHDLPAAKVGSISKMLKLCYLSPEMINCTIVYNQDRINCNLIQAYILLSTENVQTAIGVIDALEGGKGSASIDVDVSGARCKFKKYIAMKNKMGVLSETTRALCVYCKLL